MTLDLVFVLPSSVQATLAQLAADTGVTAELVGRRSGGMEIFSVSILTIRVAGEQAGLDAAHAWFARRGIHRLAA